MEFPLPWGYWGWSYPQDAPHPHVFHLTQGPRDRKVSARSGMAHGAATFDPRARAQEHPATVLRPPRSIAAKSAVAPCGECVACRRLRNCWDTSALERLGAG